MKYNRYELGSYNLHIIKTDQFKTVNMRIMFKSEAKKEELNFRSFLSYILLESSKNYPTRRDLEIKCEDLYALALNSRPFISGNYALLSFDATFLNDKYTEDGLFKQVFEFIWDLLTNPKVSDNKFDPDLFSSVKENVISEIKSIQEMPDYYAEKELFKLIGKDTPISFSDEGDLDTIDNVNPTNLYEYYLNFLKSSVIDIFVVGDLNDLEVKKAIQSVMSVNTLKKPTKSHYIEHDKVRSRARIITKKGNYKQSRLLVGYKLKDLTDFEKQYVLPCYNYILGGSADSKLFKSIREKHSLCYNVYSRYITLANLIVIKAGIKAESYKKTVNLMRKEVKNMEKGLFSDEDVSKAKSILLNSYEEIEDSPVGLVSMYMLHEYLNKDLLDKRMKEVNKVTTEMVMEVAKKIHLDTIYFLEGKSNGKKN